MLDVQSRALKVRIFIYFIFKEKTSKYLKIDFGDGTWRQAEALILLLAGAVEVYACPGSVMAIHSVAVAQHPSFELRGGRFTTELSWPQQVNCHLNFFSCRDGVIKIP